MKTPCLLVLSTVVENSWGQGPSYSFGLKPLSEERRGSLQLCLNKFKEARSWSEEIWPQQLPVSSTVAGARVKNLVVIC